MDNEAGSDPSAGARERVLAELERLERQVRTAEETGLSVLMDQCRVGGPPPLEALEDQRLLAGLRDRDVARVRELLRALGRIERGEYGVCEDCGGTISPLRLEIIPEATRCATCASGGG